MTHEHFSLQHHLSRGCRLIGHVSTSRTQLAAQRLLQNETIQSKPLGIYSNALLSLACFACPIGSAVCSTPYGSITSIPCPVPEPLCARPLSPPLLCVPDRLRHVPELKCCYFCYQTELMIGCDCAWCVSNCVRICTCVALWCALLRAQQLEHE